MLGRSVARFRQVVPLPLRVVMGLAFIVHGYPKITNLALTAQNFGRQGFVPGAFWGTLVAIVEFVGGLCLVVGFLTRYWSLAIAIEMAITTLRVKVPRGAPFVSRGGQGVGYELDLMFLVVALALVVLGSGPFSIDENVLKLDL
jgi:putative oxidoreductase